MSVSVQVSCVPWNRPQQSARPKDIFERMRDLIDDPEWKLLFDNASKGTFRPGFRFDGKFLIYSPKGNPGKKLRLKLVDEDPTKLLSQCQNFFGQHGGVRTKLDQEVATRIEDELKSSKKSEISWIRIKKIDALRNLHLHLYIDRLLQIKELDESHRVSLFHDLNLLLRDSDFKNDRVVFKEGIIADIKGLKWNGARLNVETSSSGFKSLVFNDRQRTGINYRDHWEEYKKKQSKKYIAIKEADPITENA